MTVPITTFLASVLALLFVILSLHVIRYRKAQRIPLGTQDDPELMRRLKAHGNFAEYIPLALFLLFLAEWHMAHPWYVALLGVLLIAGRLLHAYSVLVHEPRRGVYRWRIIAMALTFLVIALAAITNLCHLFML